MRQLLLLRHAKSSWDDASMPDRDRPLNARGRRSAAAMRQAMRNLGLSPDVVLVSTARRTMETLEALEPWDETPLIDPIDAAGMTVPELERANADKLVARQVVKVPNVNVQPLKMRPFYILGEVRNPGEYPYRHGLTVLSAVSIAGGYTFRADQKHMAITRTSGDHQLVGRADPTTEVEPGDTIRIDEKWF